MIAAALSTLSSKEAAVATAACAARGARSRTAATAMAARRLFGVILRARTEQRSRHFSVIYAPAPRRSGVAYLLHGQDRHLGAVDGLGMRGQQYAVPSGASSRLDRRSASRP